MFQDQVISTFVFLSLFSEVRQHFRVPVPLMACELNQKSKITGLGDLDGRIKNPSAKFCGKY